MRSDSYLLNCFLRLNNQKYGGFMTSGTKGVVHDKKLHDKLVEAVYSKSEAGAEMVRKSPTEQVFSRSASGMTLLDISIMANNK